MDYSLFSPAIILLILSAISFGSLLKGMTGLGLPLFAIPALSMVIPVEDAVVIMLIPVMASNIWLVINHRQYKSILVEHKVFLVLGFVGALIGTWLLQNLNDSILKSLLAVGLGAYLLRQFANFDLIKRLLPTKQASEFHPSNSRDSILGFAAGILQGASGMSAQVIAPYYHAYGLKNAPYAFIVATSFLFFGIGQLTAMTGLALLDQQRLSISLIALIPTLLFTRIGIGQAHRISPELFNKVLLIMFVAMEIGLIIDIVNS